MNPRAFTTYAAVAVMTALLVVYLVFAVQYGLVLIGVGEPIPVAIGVALLVFPVLGFGVIAAELNFTVRGNALGRRLEADGGMPAEELPLRASGRIDRVAADELFPTYQAATEADPENWRTWFRLGLAYDASGDRRRARWATRQAIRLSRR
ncbi:hypothetical protein BH11ACT3_BH11ACT3_23500 [soil metagenome]